MLTFIIILIVVFFFGYYLFKGITLFIFGGFKEDAPSKNTYITKHYHDNRSVHFHDTNQQAKDQKRFPS
jgi:hypothetical protein